MGERRVSSWQGALPRANLPCSSSSEEGGSTEEWTWCARTARWCTHPSRGRLTNKPGPMETAMPLTTESSFQDQVPELKGMRLAKPDSKTLRFVYRVLH